MLLTTICYIFYTLLTIWLLAGVWAASAPHQEYTPLTRAELRQAAKLYIPTTKVGNRSNAVILNTLLNQGYV
jgi:hypothetical protein